MRGRGRSVGIGLVFVLAAVGLAWAQKADEKPEAPKAAPLVVRLGVDLVQVDAVVLDKKGTHVTDLKADDFEILQDGKPRQITHCEYVVAALAPAVSSAPPSPAHEAAPPPSLVPLRREDVRRVMAFVVDDYNLSADGIHRVTQGLGKVIAEELRSGDLIAIVRTSGGMGIFHQFTNDRRVLDAALRDLRERMPGMGMGEHDVGTAGLVVRDSARDAHFAQATLFVIRHILDALRTLPGRKSVVLFSERLQILTTSLPAVQGADDHAFDPVDGRLAEALREVTDMANRSSTVIYAVDPRGPATLGIGAHRRIEFDLQPGGPDPGEQWRQRQDHERDDRTATQTGMDALARQTGGLFFSMVNHVDKAVLEIREDQKGYYVLGYVPDESTFVKEKRGPSFRRLEVKVKRPGLRVRSRAGFAGVPDNPVPSFSPDGRQQTLVQAMVSPFAANTLPIRLTPVFGHHPQEGAVVRVYIHVDVSSLSFTEVEGIPQAKVELAAAIFGEKGHMLPPINRDVVLTVRADRLAAVKEVGLAIDLSVPVPRPGSYQVRVALREPSSGYLGSATQFVPIPDLGKRRLALSGVVLGTLTSRSSRLAASDVTVTAASRMSPAIRRFPPGAEVSYGFAVYHPQVQKASGKPQLSSRARLVRHGKVVFDHDLSAVQVMRSLDAASDKKAKGVPAFVVAGTFALPKDLEPGEYAVQLAVEDAATGKDGRKAAGQWTSLEVAALP